MRFHVNPHPLIIARMIFGVLAMIAMVLLVPVSHWLAYLAVLFVIDAGAFVAQWLLGIPVLRNGR